ncbi:MAG: D-glycero-beta-D-manno-heptose 1-phosphate adenylyltransferase [Bacteroidales bacterium]|nr:D-glycero-beta-D-manno-heptose 1-phosphate adenylyltransferase [Bacteroidales bacterium]
MTKLQVIESKILNGERLSGQIAIWRFRKKKVVFTNGCFDLLHLGHIDYLTKAAELGDVLILGLNTDNSVRRLKGNSRPISGEKSRSMVLAALHFVDAVVLFDEDTPAELIRKVQPDVLVKGGDYVREEVAGYETVMAKGGEVVILDLVPGYSTSAIEEKIINSR